MHNQTRTGFALIFAMGLISVACSSITAQKAPADIPAAAETKPAPPAATPAAVPASTKMSYTVVAGDHLWGIASKMTVYGDAYKWPLIFSRNRSQIDDPDLIYPGQVFTIEKNPARAEIRAAIEHARTRGRWKLGAVEKSDREYVAALVVK